MTSENFAIQETMTDEKFKAFRIAINERLNTLLDQDFKEYTPLKKAAIYAINSGGKRLRPLLLLTALDALGSDWHLGIDAACSVEMIHTYSIIHDDLPALDNDDIRRGKPTLHKAFGEATAILTGDLFLTLSFEVLSTQENLSDKNILAMISSLSKASGAHGMIGGQTLDILEVNQTIDQLNTQHLLKTGSLFGACFAMAAILANKPDPQPFFINGQNLGLIYQMQDDLLDPIQKNSDAKKGKSTALTLLGKPLLKQKIDHQLSALLSEIEPWQSPLLTHLIKNILQTYN